MKRSLRYFYFLVIILLILVGCTPKTTMIHESSDAVKAVKEETDAILVRNDSVIVSEQEENIDKNEEVENLNDHSQIKIWACGDIIYHMPLVNSCYNHDIGAYDFEPPLRFVKEVIRDGDINVVNFESAINLEKPFSGFPLFNTPKEALWALPKTGYNLINTANNHTLDGGELGLLTVLNACHEFGVTQIGTQYMDQERTRIFEIKDKKVGFLSYTYALNGNEWMLSPEQTDQMINVINQDKIKTDVDFLKEQEVDQIIAIMHWGNEYQETASNEQVELAHLMIDWGVDVILGSHPHVVQNTEIYQAEERTGVIIYSMGNFLSNQYESTMGNARSEDGLMIELIYDLSEESMDLTTVNYHPTWVFRDGNGQYQILPINQYFNGDFGDYEVTDWARGRMESSYNATMEKMAPYVFNE